MSEWQLAIGGMVVLLSWIGWGGFLTWALRMGRVRCAWGMQAAIGMSAVTVFGGVLAMVGSIGVGTLGVWTGAGVVFAIIGAARRRDAILSGMKRAGVWAAGLTAIGLLMYTVALQSTSLNPGDDLEAYTVFPKQMLESGTLLAPYSIRRLGTYGGQQLLQAQWMATVRCLWGEPGEQLCLTHGHVVDAGLCTAVAAGILWGAMRPRTERRRMFASLAIAMMFVAMVQRVNTHAQASGVALFLALWQLLPLLRRRGVSSIPTGVLVGLVAAGAASLRMNYAGAAGVTLLTAGILAATRGSGRWAGAAMAIAAMTALLTPWAIVLEWSSGSPFYPLILGNDRGTFLSTGLTAAARAAWAGMSLLYPLTWAYFFAWVPALFMRRYRDLVPLLAGATVMAFLLGWSFTNQETVNLYRLASPVLMAGAWACLAVMMKRWNRSALLFRCGTLALLALLATSGAYPYSDSFRHSFSLAVLPVFLIAAWAVGARWRWNAGRWCVGVAAACLVLWMAYQNRTRVAEGGIFFFDMVGMVVFAAIAFRAITHPARIGATATAGTVGVIFLMGWVGIAGMDMVLMVFLWMAAIVAVLWWAGRGAQRLQAWLALGAIAGIAVLSMVNRNFLLESLAPWICVASAGAAAWVAFKEERLAGKGAAIAALVAAVYVGLPNIVVVYQYGSGLMAMGICALAATVMVRMRLHPLLPAALLLTGTVLLGKDEVPALMAGGGGRVYDAQVLQEFAKAQESTPAGSSIFTWVVTPALFDFGRNRVLVPDYDGEYASPPPGLPIRSDAAALRAYLLQRHVEYAVIEPERIRTRPSKTSVGPSLDELSRSCRVLFRSPGLVVFDLRN